MEVPLALVFDSDPVLRSRIAATLSEAGLAPVQAGTAPEALDVFRTRPVAVAVLGVASPGEALYDLLGRGLRLRPTAVAAVVEGDGAARAVEAAKAGAFDVLARPPLPGRLRAFAVRAAAQHRLLEEVRRGRAVAEGLRRVDRLPSIGLDPDAIEALARHRWPGSVRELRDSVETAVVLGADGVVRLRDLPAPVRGGSGAPFPGVRAERGFREAKRAVVEAFERVYLVDLLERSRGQVTVAAARAGLLRTALQRLLRKHDLRSQEFRGRAEEPGGA